MTGTADCIYIQLYIPIQNFYSCTSTRILAPTCSYLHILEEEPLVQLYRLAMEREDRLARPTEESPPGPECGEDERLLLQFHAIASALRCS